MSATPSVKRKTEAEIKKIKDDQLSAEETRRNAEREEREKEERWSRTPWNDQMFQNVVANLVQKFTAFFPNYKQMKVVFWEVWLK